MRGLEVYITIVRVEITLHILSELDSFRPHTNTAAIKMCFMLV